MNKYSFSYNSINLLYKTFRNKNFFHSNNLIKIFVCIFLLFSCVQLSASPFTERSKVGDLWLAGSVLYAYGMTAGASDLQGTVELTELIILTQLLGEGLKSIVKEERPNGKNNRSFPSGHAMGAFQAASFVHKRYGFIPAIPDYLMAIAVSWSRVDQKAHYTHDVLAGAAIACLFSYLFAGKNENVTIDYTTEGLSFGLHWNL